MKYSIDSFQTDIEECIKLCREELFRRKNGINGESTIEQLENIILPELEMLLQKIRGGDLPIKSDRYLSSFANAFRVWGWDMEVPTELFVKLTRINNSFSEI